MTSRWSAPVVGLRSAMAWRAADRHAGVFEHRRRPRQGWLRVPFFMVRSVRFLRVAALHELGHAIVAAELGHAVDRISIISGVDTGGTASTRLVTLFPTLAQVRSAYSIRARGLEWPHHEAGHTTAPDHMPKANEKPLASRWASTHD